MTPEKTHHDSYPEDFHVLDDAGRLPIHWAVSGGHLELTQFLSQFLSGKESIDSADDMGWTPLMIASSAGRKNIVQFLLEAGADPRHTTNNGQTPLHYAASKEHCEIANLLLENGVDVNAQDNLGSTPLHRAASKGNTKMVHLLLSISGCNPNVADREKNTPLHLSCEEKRTEASIMLVKRGAHLDRLNKHKGQLFPTTIQKQGHDQVSNPESLHNRSCLVSETWLLFTAPYSARVPFCLGEFEEHFIIKKRLFQTKSFDFDVMLQEEMSPMDLAEPGLRNTLLRLAESG